MNHLNLISPKRITKKNLWLNYGKNSLRRKFLLYDPMNPNFMDWDFQLYRFRFSHLIRIQLIH